MLGRDEDGDDALLAPRAVRRRVAYVQSAGRIKGRAREGGER